MTTRTDEPSCRPWPAYPRWIIRRLRHLHIQFARDSDDPLMKIAHRNYAAINGGNGGYLSDQHLELLARAWICVGPHVSTPPPHRIPCIINLLGRLGMEDSLLEDWLLSMAGDHLRLHSWTGDQEDMQALGMLLHGKQIRRYWEWLTDLVEDACAQNNCIENRHERHVVASRATFTLYSGCPLKSLIRRVEAWSRAHPRTEEADPRAHWPEHEPDARPPGMPRRIRDFVPGIGIQDPALVFQQLWHASRNSPQSRQATSRFQ